MPRFLIAAAIALAATPALAIYKCPQPGGGVSYQDSPCAGGQGRQLDLPAVAAPSSGQLDDTQASPPEPDTAASIAAKAGAMALERRLRELQLELQAVERQLANAKETRDADLAAVDTEINRGHEGEDPPEYTSVHLVRQRRQILRAFYDTAQPLAQRISELKREQDELARARARTDQMRPQLPRAAPGPGDGAQPAPR
jgi:hypothetical protein